MVLYSLGMMLFDMRHCLVCNMNIVRHRGHIYIANRSKYLLRSDSLSKPRHNIVNFQIRHLFGGRMDLAIFFSLWS